MCGILVAFAKKGTLDENSCSRASKKIFSRGPDFNFSRFKLNGKLFLSQTVLSITGNPQNNLNYGIYIISTLILFYEANLFLYELLSWGFTMLK